MQSEPKEPYEYITRILFESIGQPWITGLEARYPDIARGEQALEQLRGHLNSQQQKLLIDVLDGKSLRAVLERELSFASGLSAGLRLICETTLPQWPVD